MARPSPVPPSLWACAAAVEPLEDPGPVLGCDAGALVGDVQHDAADVFVGLQPDGAAVGGVPLRVVDQVGQHLVQALAVAEDPQVVRVDVDVELHRPAGHRRLVPADEQELLQPDRREPQ